MVPKHTVDADFVERYITFLFKFAYLYLNFKKCGFI